MRVVGGALKGRVLQGPRSQGPGPGAIRPTSDRLRETIFNVLAHGLGRHGIEDPVPDARVLDLFAGTGALAVEALSRGAAFAAMVDIGAEARGLQRGHVEALGLGGQTRILRRDATKLGPVAPFEPFGLVFCDPPYGRGLGERAIASAIAGGWLAPDAVVVLEERAGIDVALPPPLELLDQRQAGESQTLIGRMPPA